MLLLIEFGKNERGETGCEGKQMFSFGHGKIEMYVEYPSTDVK